MRTLTPKVAIIGGGPAGLSAAAVLGKALGTDALVIDREREAGGIPRHADHPGYGMRDRLRFQTGPVYARALVREAVAAGAEIATRMQVTGWADDKTLEATSPSGRTLIRPEVFVLATGARERPRPARLIPGDRTAGVLTTGQLQNLVHLHHRQAGTKAVVVGAELVSWSAAMTLREAGCEVDALVSQYPAGESYWFFTRPGKMWFKTRVETESRVVAVHGRGRVEAVEIENLRTGHRSRIACDTVVFTGDWIPDNELARMAELAIDPASKAPVVDGAMRTSREGIFAVGNLNHPVETADVVALEGKFVGERVLEYLGGTRAADTAVALRVERPLRWVSPSVYRPADPAPARNRLVAWADDAIRFPTVVVQQGSRVIAEKRLAWPLAPGRAFRIPADVLKHVDSSNGNVTISIR